MLPVAQFVWTGTVHLPSADSLQLHTVFNSEGKLSAAPPGGRVAGVDAMS